MATWQLSNSESYDIHTGYSYHGDNELLTSLYNYGFTQEVFIPGLGQYQAINQILEGEAGFRKGVGKSVQMAGFLYGVDRYIRWLNAYSGGGGYLTAAQRKLMMLRPSMKFPISPFGKLFKGIAGIQVAIAYYDLMRWLANIPIAEGQSFLDGLAVYAQWGRY